MFVCKQISQKIMAKKRNKKEISHGTKKTNKNQFRPSRKQLAGLSLRERMMIKLKSSHFRYLNEELYNMNGKHALKYFRENSKAFEDYHAGYKQQVEKWPLNPLDIIIKSVNQELSDGSVVADLGCGEARLAERLPRLKVYSFDLVALNPRVTVCDMSNTPLTSSSVDCVVCCLSLMGTNLTDCIKEANRILKIGGVFKIAEVESRFDDVEDFLRNLSAYGFKVVKTDLEKDLFYFIDLRKERNIGKRGKKKLPDITLKACLYKKR